MDTRLREQLARITDVEREVMAENYNLFSDAEPAFAGMKLRRRDYLFNVIDSPHIVGVRPHTRFVDIPIHAHNYLEMMYVLQGEVVHRIDGVTYRLGEGQFLLMNRHVRHEIKASGEGDLAVNLIVSADFFTVAAARFRHDPSLRDFADEDRAPNGKPRHLIYDTAALPAVGSLMENLIRASLFESEVPQAILSDTLSLLFRYLETYPKMLRHTGADASGEDPLRRSIGGYLQNNYRTASLAELAEQLGISVPYLSRRVKELYGVTFTVLLHEKRFAEAEDLLLHSDLPITAIAEAVGYENNSFFHRRFRLRCGISPSRFRKQKTIP